jgi:hypothetical protein
VLNLNSKLAVLLWRFAMIAGGLAFGLLGDRRPLGDAPLAHPLVVFAGVAGISLLLLRVVLARPVPEVIPERSLLVGFLFGFAAFLIGNWISIRLIGGG